MAVEKSYARPVSLIVLTLVLLLVTAVFFIQRLKERPGNRPGHLHHRQRLRLWTSPAPFGFTACRWAASQPYV